MGGFCSLTSFTDSLTAHESNQMALPHALGHHMPLDTRAPREDLHHHCELSVTLTETYPTP